MRLLKAALIGAVLTFGPMMVYVMISVAITATWYGIMTVGAYFVLLAMDEERIQAREDARRGTLPKL